MPLSLLPKNATKWRLGRWHTNILIWIPLFRPVLEATPGSYYTLSGLVIPRHSSQPNHLVKACGNSAFQDFSIKKKIAESSEAFFFKVYTIYWFTHAFPLNVNLNLVLAWGVGGFTALTVRPWRHSVKKVIQRYSLQIVTQLLNWTICALRHEQTLSL